MSDFDRFVCCCGGGGVDSGVRGEILGRTRTGSCKGRAGSSSFLRLSSKTDFSNRMRGVLLVTDGSTVYAASMPQRRLTSPSGAGFPGGDAFCKKNCRFIAEAAEKKNYPPALCNSRSAGCGKIYLFLGFWFFLAHNS